MINDEYLDNMGQQQPHYFNLDQDTKVFVLKNSENTINLGPSTTAIIHTDTLKIYRETAMGAAGPRQQQFFTLDSPPKDPLPPGIEEGFEVSITIPGVDTPSGVILHKHTKGFNSAMVSFLKEAIRLGIPEGPVTTYWSHETFNSNYGQKITPVIAIDTNTPVPQPQPQQVQQQQQQPVQQQPVQQQPVQQQPVQQQPVQQQPVQQQPVQQQPVQQQPVQQQPVQQQVQQQQQQPVQQQPVQQQVQQQQPVQQQPVQQQPVQQQPVQQQPVQQQPVQQQPVQQQPPVQQADTNPATRDPNDIFDTV